MCRRCYVALILCICPTWIFVPFFVNARFLPCTALVSCCVFQTSRDKVSWQIVSAFHFCEQVLSDMLSKVCRVQRWTRAIDSNTSRPLDFGFCVVSTPAGLLRLVRLFNGMEIDAQKITVKANENAQKVLDHVAEEPVSHVLSPVSTFLFTCMRL